MTRLSDILKLSSIKVPLQATDKTTAITLLVDALFDSGQIIDKKKVLAAVLEREATRSTGIGAGLAIPHGKSQGTSQLAMAIGKPATPIDFQAIDGRPVTLICLVTSPPDQTGPHISALAKVTRLMTLEKFRATIASISTPEQMLEAIRTQET